MGRPKLNKEDVKNDIVQVKDNLGKGLNQKELDKITKEQYTPKNQTEKKEEIVNYYNRTKTKLLTTFKNGVVKSRLIGIKKQGKKIF